MELATTDLTWLGQPGKEQTEQKAGKDAHIFSAVRVFSSILLSLIVPIPHLPCMHCSVMRSMHLLIGFFYSHPRALPAHPGLRSLTLSARTWFSLSGAGVAFGLLVGKLTFVVCLGWHLVAFIAIVAVARGTFLIFGWTWKHVRSWNLPHQYDGSGSTRSDRLVWALSSCLARHSAFRSSTQLGSRGVPRT